ncbi:hypothetical protein KIPB_012884, partial [Kipferlia bialata]
FIGETVAAKILVSRVACGAYFNRRMTPLMCSIVEGVLPPYSEAQKQEIFSLIESCGEAKIAVERSCLISMITQQGGLAAPSVTSGDKACDKGDSGQCVLDTSDTNTYVTARYSAIYGWMAPEADGYTGCMGDTPAGTPCLPHSTLPALPLSVSGCGSLGTGTPDKESVGVESATVCTSDQFASPAEHRIMRQNGIEFLPLVVYSKLDIVGFTHFCSLHGTEVVSLLNMLFMAFDGILDKYQAEGVTKVKTVGDAYELMRPFGASELRLCTMADVTGAVAALTMGRWQL